jgi:hypothetical protein
MQYKDDNFFTLFYFHLRLHIFCRLFRLYMPLCCHTWGMVEAIFVLDVVYSTCIHLGAVWFKKCNANGNGNGFGSITGGNKFE